MTAQRTCNKCGISRSIFRFRLQVRYGSGTARVSRRVVCKECENAYQRTKNKEPQVAAYRASLKLTQFKRNRQIIIDAKSKPCEDCNIQYPYYVMDFDHVRGQKFNKLSRMGNNGMSSKKVLDEIAKCDVVCANCHREREHRRKMANTPVAIAVERAVKYRSKR